jgi:hypothetical protein
VIPKRARAKDGHWKVWENFIATFENVDAYLDGESQSVKLSFSKFLPRDSKWGSLHPAGKLLEVDQWRSTYGPSERRLHWTTTCLDPRYTNTEKLHPAIGKLQRSYAKEDPPPQQVKPIPLPLVWHTVAEYHCSSDFVQAIMDLTIIAFFYLL